MHKADKIIQEKERERERERERALENSPPQKYCNNFLYTHNYKAGTGHPPTTLKITRIL